MLEKLFVATEKMSLIGFMVAVLRIEKENYLISKRRVSKDLELTGKLIFLKKHLSLL